METPLQCLVASMLEVAISGSIAFRMGACYDVLGSMVSLPTYLPHSLTHLEIVTATLGVNVRDK